MAIITQTQGALEYFTAQSILVPHGFTTRSGGVSQGSLASLNLGLHRGDRRENVEKNYDILGAELGFSREDLVLTRQIHSDIVRPVTHADCRGIDNHDYPECDGLITRDPGTALMIFTADCTPILFWDPVTGAVGACHAGWRGTVADIAGKTVRAMAACYGCRPADIRCAIGPNIGPCCFETGPEVPQAAVAAFGEAALDAVRPAGDKYYVNLKALNALALRRAGAEQIEISGECTMCGHDRFWSHRYTRGDRGAQGAIIVCKEVAL